MDGQRQGWMGRQRGRWMDGWIKEEREKAVWGRREGWMACVNGDRWITFSSSPFSLFSNFKYQKGP